MRTVILIYNPTAGKAAISAHLDYIIAQYQHEGYLLVPHRIGKERGGGVSRAGELICALKPEYIIIAGGDGTVNRWVNYAKNNDINLPMAILPLGTANDFARMVGMPTDIKKAIRHILQGAPKRYDLGRVNDRYFINILSSGLMTDVSQKTPTAMKNLFGRVAYYFSVMGELPSFDRMTIRMSDSRGVLFSGECLLFLVLNGRTAGNLSVAQGASAQDGLLEVLVFKGDNIGATIGDLFHILFNKGVNYPQDVVYIQSSHLKIELYGQQILTDIDGESGCQYPLDIECLHRHIEIIC